MTIKPERTDESRVLLRRAFDIAMGSYIEQEAKKGDSWRESSYGMGDAFAHLKHELEEVRANLVRSDSRTLLLHNLIDMVLLSVMLLAKVLIEGGEL